MKNRRKYAGINASSQKENKTASNLLREIHP
jgi:hypothetical protein